MPRKKQPHVSRHKVMDKPRGSERAPVLLLSGKWLAAAGFTIAAKYAAVVVHPGCIVLLTVHDPEATHVARQAATRRGVCR